MKYKKIFVLIITLIFVFTLSGCKKDNKNTSSDIQNTNTSKEQKNYITLLYSVSDTINPYTAITDANKQLCKLVYEPLVKLDNNYNPSCSLAESVNTEGNQCTVIIKDVKFSDNSSVTADDVIYSYKAALNSTTIYKSKLYEVKSVTSVNSKTVVFNLTRYDRFFQNLLDFPIIKAGTDTQKNSDGVIIAPIGSGRYKMSDDQKSLVCNDLFYNNTATIKEIRLINAPDAESVSHYVEIGAADMFYSEISDGHILRMSGKKVNINLNNLVYIGFNYNYGGLSDSNLRQIISSGINRSNIVKNCYYNNALSATGFFNPDWEEVKSVQNIQIEANQKITIENLEKIGYNNIDNKGVRFNSNGNALKYTLLVNSENSIRVSAAKAIASDLFAFGISVTVVEQPFEQYCQSLLNGNFQMYLSEVMITDNMDVTNLVLEGGSCAYGIKNASKEDTDKNQKSDDKTQADSSNPQNNDSSAEDNSDESEPQEPQITLVDAVNGFYSGTNTINDIASILQNEMPIVPVCYRTGVLFYNDNIENVSGSSACDPYFSIESYTVYG